MIFHKNLDQQVFECRISPSRQGVNVSATAFVLFDKGAVILLSNMVSDEGSVIMRVTDHSVQIDPTAFDIEIIGPCVSPNVKTYEDINRALRITAANGFLWATLTSSGHVKVYEQMDPPRGRLAHKGFIETSAGRKQVARYGCTDTYRVTDTNTSAWVDINLRDIKDYFK